MALHELASADAAAVWLQQRGATALATDSRTLRSGDAFIAWPGHAHDARTFVHRALESGAVACLVESNGIDRYDFGADERIATLAGLKAMAGPVASRFMAEPSRQLRVVACTGTNGKTSSAWWIAQALTSLGLRCGVVGTLGIGEPPTPVFNGLTTPDPVVLQTALRNFVDADFGAVALEASSIGLAEDRLAGTHIEIALFTNFTQDHLDYHADMAAYWQAKARLFAWEGLHAAVVNVDDAQGLALADAIAKAAAVSPVLAKPRVEGPALTAAAHDEATASASALGARAIDLWTCGRDQAARLRASDIKHRADGLAFTVHEGAASAEVDTVLIGGYNVSNLLGVIGVLRASGFALADAAAACAGLTPVPGRMQRIAGPAQGPQVVVDYAHTPDALEKALVALRPFADARGGKLWCVVGCGGNRDAAKRPLMGALAARFADRVVVTSDNPRFESPDFIISQILVGVVGHDDIDVVENRGDAVAHAVGQADARDVILLAGKGHEDYQDIGGVKQPFSDAAHATSALERRQAGSPVMPTSAAGTGSAPVTTTDSKGAAT